MSLRELTDEVIKDFIESLKDEEEFNNTICDKLKAALLDNKTYSVQKLKEVFYGEDDI